MKEVNIDKLTNFERRKDYDGIDRYLLFVLNFGSHFTIGSHIVLDIAKVYKDERN